MEAVVEPMAWNGLENLRGVLRALLSRHCADANEVEDVIHETFLRAVRYRGNLEDVARLRSWSMRIALNVLSDRKRRGRRVVTTPPEDVPDPEPEEPEDDALFRLGRFELDRERALAVMGEELTRLRGEDRRVLDSFYRGAQSCRETAEECDIPAHLVKIRLFRARQRLVRAIRRRLALDADRPVPAAAGDQA